MAFIDTIKAESENREKNHHPSGVHGQKDL